MHGTFKDNYGGMQMKRQYGLRDLFKIPYKANHVMFFAKIFEYLIYSIIPLLEFYVMSEFINVSIKVVKNKSFNEIVFPMVSLILIIEFKHLSQQIFKLSTYRLELEVDGYIKKLILQKKAKLEYECIENKDMYDKANRLSDKASQRILEGLKALLDIIIIFVKFITSVYVIIKYIGIGGIGVIFVSIPIFILSSFNGKAAYKNTKSLTDDTRTMDYLSEILTKKEYCEERALFGYADSLNEKWKSLSRSKTTKIYLVIAKLFFTMDISAVLMILLSGVIIYIFTLKAISGAVTLGVIISLTNLLKDLADQMRWGMMDNISTLAEDKEYFEDFNEFMLFSEKDNSLMGRAFKELDIKTIKLCNVSFRYPSSDKEILHNINFEFEKGKHYAIVGKNGSGKTTLVKLLTGMYSNYDGEILFDDVELRKLDLNTIRNMYSIVFQDFAKYPLDIKSNIIFGNISEPTDTNRFNQCLSVVDMYDFVNGLQDKENTFLGKIKENSIEISGGEWQKLAMARALYNPSKIRILDEPTAAMDPISESDLYEKFGLLSKGVTSIFISHRLGSTMLADTIIVLDKGEIIESGSHLELMQNKGLYYELYSEQRSWYNK